MQRWRLFILAGLIGTPLLILLGLGGYYLWISGLGFWMWWPLSGCVVLAYFLAWRWQKQRRLLAYEPPVPLHWTERDLQAWKLVEERAKQSERLKTEQLLVPSRYLETAQDLALELARFYHPNAKDPIGYLTIPEILTVVELATQDLVEMVDKYLPGGHLLTINDLKRVKQIADWYPTVNNIWWIVSSLFNPVSTAVKYLAVQGGMTFPWQMLQENVLLWFFTAYVHRMGHYLIEVNSGRLRVGAQRYRQLQNSGAPDPSQGEPVIPTVTMVVVGQAKAGKSSVINALLGERKAITDVIPTTAEITRYELQPPGVSSRFLLLDTVGYGNAGPRQDQLRATEDAARRCDLILLVLHARNPLRQADLELLQGLESFFQGRPDMRKPPILAVLTHIDLLSPSLEWDPPYDWQQPQRIKEHQMHEAIATVAEQLGARLNGAIPVCSAADRIYGIAEWLLTSLTQLLDQAHAVAFLHCLKAETDSRKVRRVFEQLLAAGKGLGQILLQTHRK